ncbi:MAG: transporter [Pseudomonadota bacterium]
MSSTIAPRDTCLTGIAKLVAVLLFLGFLSSETVADDGEDIAQQLANPVASLISVPLQLNYDDGFGLDGDGTLLRLNVQPVIPIDLSPNWNLISRTIIPLVYQEDFPVAGSSDWGLSDTVQSFFFSPKEPTSSGWIWGVGPALLLPTGTDKSLGSEKWGAGPTGVALKQSGAWTYGGLANHLESFAGESSRADVSATFIQPFLTYITPTKTTLALNTESTYDWEVRKWSVPINFTVTQLLVIGDQIVSVGGGVRYWATAPDPAAEGWGVRLIFTLVYPK